MRCPLLVLGSVQASTVPSLYPCVNLPVPQADSNTACRLQNAGQRYPLLRCPSSFLVRLNRLTLVLAVLAPLAAAQGGVFCGDLISCAMMQSSGGLRCWGDGTSGEVGTGASSNVLTPPATNNPGLSNVISVALGQYHGCAMVSGGATYCWGACCRCSVAIKLLSVNNLVESWRRWSATALFLCLVCPGAPV